MAAKKKADALVAKIHRALRAAFPLLSDNESEVVYRYNSFAVRIRVVDERFEGKTTGERERFVMRALKDGGVTEAEIYHITMIVMMTPEEEALNAVWLDQDFQSGATHTTTTH